MLRALYIMPLLFLSGSVLAETFQCAAKSGGPAALVATIDEDKKSGEVSVAGVNYDAHYRVYGFDRVWTFKDEELGTVYKLQIGPDGSGTSYENVEWDGKPTGLSDHTFDCQQQKADAAADIVPIVTVGPVYPARALSRGIEGYVDLTFTVTATGSVQNPTVIYSTNPIFDSAAIRTVLKYKYEERIGNLSGVKTRILFSIEAMQKDQFR